MDKIETRKGFLSFKTNLLPSLEKVSKVKKNVRDSLTIPHLLCKVSIPAFIAPFIALLIALRPKVVVVAIKGATRGFLRT